MDSFEKTIAGWKSQYGKVRAITTTDKDGVDIIFYFRQPDMKILGVYAKYFDNDPMQALIVLFQNCLLNKELAHFGDDPEVMLSIAEGLNSMVKKRPSKYEDL